MTPATIVLAEDHQVVREGLRLLLDRQPGLSVVGETSDGLEVVALVERLKPDVLITGLVMSGLSGLDVAREVKRRTPNTKIVILSMHSSEAFVLPALRNGASAYVLKDAGSRELLTAVAEAIAGRRYLSPPLSEQAIDALVRRAEAAGGDAYDALTTREREVFHLAAEGLGDSAIGERLGISPRTAETHRAHTMEKLGLKGRMDLVTYAIERGLVAARSPLLLSAPRQGRGRKKA